MPFVLPGAFSCHVPATVLVGAPAPFSSAWSRFCHFLHHHLHLHVFLLPRWVYLLVWVFY
jgi:hypothetical protein